VSQSSSRLSVLSSIRRVLFLVGKGRAGTIPLSAIRDGYGRVKIRPLARAASDVIGDLGGKGCAIGAVVERLRSRRCVEIPLRYRGWSARLCAINDYHRANHASILSPNLCPVLD